MQSTWLDEPILKNFRITWETVLVTGILLLAVFSRFYLLEPRVMSHDETIHIYHNSWTLYQGRGYLHDPLSHGPFQTHLVALSYFLFGDSDLTARIPAVLFSIVTVAFAWNFRRYIGKTGAIVAMLLMLISPYMLYYGRYVRNEAFAALFGVVLLWGILRYLETGAARYAYWVTIAIVLHFTAKETAFIYAAQALLFLAGYFIYRVARNEWVNPEVRGRFFAALIIGSILLGGALGLTFYQRGGLTLSPTETVAPPIPGQELEALPSTAPSALLISAMILGVIALLVAAYYLFKGYSSERVRNDRALGLLILIGTLVLPQLSAFPVRIAGWDIPTNYTEVRNMTPTDIYHVAIFLVPMFLISILVGLWWNRGLWLVNATIFYGLYIVFYTTIFTNGAGFFTGTVGSLGYWLEQQGVRRGSQPWYYYVLVQIPVYEYLPAIASLVGLVMAALGIKPKVIQSDNQLEHVDQAGPGLFGADIQPEEVDPGDSLAEAVITNRIGEKETVPALGLLGFWVITSIAAYTLAGEKMPWLTVHIAWPMILYGAWPIGYLIDTIDWSVFRTRRGWLIIVLILVLLSSLLALIGSVFSTTPPFQGQELPQLQATSTFLLSLIVVIVSGIGLYSLVKGWPIGQLLRVISVFIFAGMGILTARTAYQASYINYDDANELLVYAHSAGGVKVVMDQVEEISRRTTDGLALPVAFDGEYPFWWYLRNYTATNYYGSAPTRSLREYPIILVGEGNFGKIEPVVGQGYQQFDYIRLWWPNQDYFNLTWERIRNALTNPQMRSALFKIWLNRDYTAYGQVVGRDMSLPNWSPASRMRLYIRKDIVSQIWNFGSAPVAEELEIDPYEGKQEQLSASLSFGTAGVEGGQFQRPRGIAVAPDGSIYVTDTDNHRIQHFMPDGTLLNTWGTFGDANTGQALGGTFNQPWGIEVGPDGSVYVADTWNHRVQKFTADGEFVVMWGFFGQAESPEAFWGPRDIAVDAQGRVFVTDTGNKRVVVFDGNGVYQTQFGTVGVLPGEFDEPVGIAIDGDGAVYVADTWNQRIQVFSEIATGFFQPLRSWDIAGWYGQSLDNKPYLAVDARGHVFASDPEGYRVLEFDDQGQIVRYWGDYGVGPDGFALVGAVAVDEQGGVWVTDAGNNRVMYFTLPANP